MSVEKKNNSKSKTISNSKMCLASGDGDCFELIYVNCAYILHIHTDIVYIYLVYMRVISGI